jgi:DNA-binding transcriptional MocR family regulator
LVFQVLESVRDREVVPLGSAFPSPMLFPLGRLARCLSLGAKQMDPWSTLEDLPPGSAELRSQIARRYLRCGSRVAPEEIIVTAGALEHGFSIAPGPIFSAKRQFRRCLRINYGHEWSPAFDAAAAKLGEILRSAPRSS